MAKKKKIKKTRVHDIAHQMDQLIQNNKAWKEAFDQMAKAWAASLDKIIITEINAS